MNKADMILVREFNVEKDDTLNLVFYDGDTYVQRTNNAGAKTDYYLSGAGSPISVSVDTETQLLKPAHPIVLSLTEFITDNVGNIYGKLYSTALQVEDVDGSGKATLVGRQPGGRFGKG